MELSVRSEHFERQGGAEKGVEKGAEKGAEKGLGGVFSLFSGFSVGFERSDTFQQAFQQGPGRV